MPDVLAELGAQVRPLARREYDLLVDLGAFEGEPIELLEGWLVQMSPEGPRHHWAVWHLNNLLARALPADLAVGVGHPFVAGDLSEPEPDLQITDVDAVTPAHHADKAHLVIEVSHCSRRKDLVPKARIYAAAGIPEYWVVDLVADEVVVHRAPSPDGYGTVTRHGPGATLNACGVPVQLAEILTPPAGDGGP